VTRVENFGNQILLISEKVSSSTKHRERYSGDYVSKTILVGEYGRLNWVQDSEASGQIAFGMDHSMFRKIVIGTEFEYHAPIPREDGYLAQGRITNRRPLGLFPIRVPETSLEFLAVFDIGAIYVNLAGSLTREVPWIFFAKAMRLR
jgi:hypothetical protein